MLLTAFLFFIFFCGKLISLNHILSVLMTTSELTVNLYTMFYYIAIYFVQQINKHRGTRVLEPVYESIRAGVRGY